MIYVDGKAFRAFWEVWFFKSVFVFLYDHDQNLCSGGVWGVFLKSLDMFVISVVFAHGAETLVFILSLCFE